MKKSALCVKLGALFAVFFCCLFIIATLNVYANDVIMGSVGEGVGSVLRAKYTEGVKKIADKGGLLSATKVITPNAISSSDIIGMYDLHAWEVRYDDGTVIKSEDYDFIGDMVITSNSTLMQRIDISGFPVVAGSGTYTLSGNNLIVNNDGPAGVSVLEITWDGTFLTTETYAASATPPFTEIDVWRKIASYAPSDQDDDGVIDDWDSCPNTPPNSCVDKNGCPVQPQSPKASTTSIITPLLLDIE
jgi:hypothetical protein